MTTKVILHVFQNYKSKLRCLNAFLTSCANTYVTFSGTQILQLIRHQRRLLTLLEMWHNLDLHQRLYPRLLKLRQQQQQHPLPPVFLHRFHNPPINSHPMRLMSRPILSLLPFNLRQQRVEVIFIVPRPSSPLPLEREARMKLAPLPTPTTTLPDRLAGAITTPGRTPRLPRSPVISGR